MSRENRLRVLCIMMMNTLNRTLIAPTYTKSTPRPSQGLRTRVMPFTHTLARPPSHRPDGGASAPHAVLHRQLPFLRPKSRSDELDRKLEGAREANPCA